MITIAKYSLPEQAHLARIKLEGQGIEAHVADENVIQWHWYLSNAIGGVRLLVAQEDEAAARACLASELDLSDTELDEEAGCFHCPACGSREVAPDPDGKSFFFVTALIGIPLPLLWPRWKCQACDWRGKESALAETAPASGE